MKTVTPDLIASNAGMVMRRHSRDIVILIALSGVDGRGERSVEQIAEMLAISVSTAKGYIRYAVDGLNRASRSTLSWRRSHSLPIEKPVAELTTAEWAAILNQSLERITAARQERILAGARAQVERENEGFRHKLDRMILEAAHEAADQGETFPISMRDLITLVWE